MSVTLIQRFLLTLVYFFVSVLEFIEWLGTLPLFFIRSWAKIVLVFFATAVFLGGGYLYYSQGLYTPLQQSAKLDQLVFESISAASGSYLGTQAQDPPPLISARAALVVDLTTNTVLYRHEDSLALSPASVTKLLTAGVALDLYPLDLEITIPTQCTLIHATKTGFFAHEKILVSDLIHALIIESSADAACALAYAHDDYSFFVEQLNAKAAAWGATSSNFTNPIGLDDFKNNQYSTAHDLYLISRGALKEAFINEIMRLKTYTLSSGNISRTIRNTNRMLWLVDGSAGIKTGTTASAGEVLTYLYEKDEARVLIVVMGSSDRFKDTISLLNWVLYAAD